MRQKASFIGIGAPTLLELTVVLGMGILALLTIIGVHGDAKLTARTCDMTRARYEASAASERDLAGLDAVVAAHPGDLDAIAAELPCPDMTMNGDVVTWSIAVDSETSLLCAVKLDPEPGAVRCSRQIHMFIPNSERDQY